MFFKKLLAFGLDISDYSIEALQLEKKLGKLSLGAYGRVKLEEGMVEDGKILKKERLMKRIRELLSTTEPRKISSRQVILSLPESKTFLHIFQVSRDLRDEALKKTLAAMAAETIPLEQEKIYWDFVEISDKEKLDPETLYLKSILYVGVLREVVDDYMEVLEGANLQVKAIDMESASLARAFEQYAAKEEGTLVVDIGARTTVLTILDEGSIRFSAVVPIAGNHFTEAISEKLRVSLKEAEKLKKKCGLDPKKEEGKIMLILQNPLQEILEEIKKSITFYEEKNRRKIKKILICGGSSFLPKLPSYFSSNLGIKTQVPDPWEGIEVEKLLKNENLKNIIKTKLHPVFFSNVIGLAKRGSEEEDKKAGINLMPPGKKPKPTFTGKKVTKSGPLRILTAAISLLIIAFLGWVLYNYVLSGIFSKNPLVETLPAEEGELIQEEETTEEESSEETTSEQEEETIPEEYPQVLIKETETGWLRVREGPGTGFPEITKVYPGESYPLLEETSEWYKIEIEEGKEGWISNYYASKQ